MAKAPDCKHDMLRAGYKFLASSKCKSCSAPIEWWLTSNGKKIPYDPLPASEYDQTTPHWATCPNADTHRSLKRGTKTISIDAQRQYLAAWRDSSDARIVVAIFDNGSAAAWRKGLPGEDLRQDLITVANNVRNQIAKEQA